MGYYCEIEYGAPASATAIAVTVTALLFCACYVMYRGCHMVYQPMLLYVTGVVATMGIVLNGIEWPKNQWKERNGVAGPPTVFEVVFLSCILWVFGLLVCCAHFKLFGG